MSQTSIPAGSPMAIKVNAGAVKGKAKSKVEAAPVDQKMSDDEELMAAMEMEDIGAMQYIDLKSMEKADLQRHAMRTYGARYGENETADYMREDIQKRMAMRSGMARYR
jgi:hypothetical protein